MGSDERCLERPQRADEKPCFVETYKTGYFTVKFAVSSNSPSHGTSPPPAMLSDHVSLKSSICTFYGSAALAARRADVGTVNAWLMLIISERK